jgi:hypothetical protein
MAQVSSGVDGVPSQLNKSRVASRVPGAPSGSLPLGVHGTGVATEFELDAFGQKVTQYAI